MDPTIRARALTIVFILTALRLFGNMPFTAKEELRTTAARGDVEGVVRALGRGADVKGADGLYALELAASNGRNETVKVLLAHGVDPNAVRKGHRKTAFILAAERGHVEVLKIMSLSGGDKDHRGVMAGRTAFTTAAERGNTAVLTVLLAHSNSSSVDAVDSKRNYTALYRATEAHMVDAVTFLLQHGADPNKNTATRGGYKDIPAASPLIRAAQLGHEDVVALMLQHGGDPLHPSAVGTALDAAKYYRFDDITALMEQHIESLGKDPTDPPGCGTEGLTKGVGTDDVPSGGDTIWA